MVIKSEPKPATIPKPAPPKVDKEAKGKATKEIGDHRKAIAWQVHRWPLEKRPVQEKTKLHLPRSYLSKAGEDVKILWPGEDLNQAVHNHYMQYLAGDEEEKLEARNCANFVAEDAITKRRYRSLLTTQYSSLFIFIT